MPLARLQRVRGMARACKPRCSSGCVPVRPDADGRHNAVAILRFFRIYLPLLVLADSLARARTGRTRHKLVALSTALGVLLSYWMPVRYTADVADSLSAVITSFRAPPADPRGPAQGLRPGPRHRARGQRRRPLHPLLHRMLGDREQLPADAPAGAEDRQIDYLTSLPANALPGVAPFVRYILSGP